MPRLNLGDRADRAVVRYLATIIPRREVLAMDKADAHALAALQNKRDEARRRSRRPAGV